MLSTDDERLLDQFFPQSSAQYFSADCVDDTPVETALAAMPPSRCASNHSDKLRTGGDYHEQLIEAEGKQSHAPTLSHDPMVAETPPSNATVRTKELAALVKFVGVLVTVLTHRTPPSRQSSSSDPAPLSKAGIDPACACPMAPEPNVTTLSCSFSDCADGQAQGSDWMCPKNSNKGQLNGSDFEPVLTQRYVLQYWPGAKRRTAVTPPDIHSLPESLFEGLLGADDDWQSRHRQSPVPGSLQHGSPANEVLGSVANHDSTSSR